MNVSSVLTAFTQAFRLTKQVLFFPFNASRWFSMGFCAWLSTLGLNGNNVNFNFNVNGFQKPLSTVRGSDIESKIGEWLSNPVVIALVATAIIVGLCIFVVMTWLSSRGDFMLMHRLYHPDETIGVCWRRSSQPGHSLFLWRLGYYAVAGVILLMYGIVMFRYVLLPFIREDGGMLLLPLFLMFLAGSLVLFFVLGLVVVFTWDFVVPMMYCNNVSAVQAWRTVLTFLRQQWLAVIVYLLLMWGGHIVVGIAVIILILCTCCIGFFLLIIPYIGAVIMLPQIYFFRAYPVYLLAHWRSDLVSAPKA